MGERQELYADRLGRNHGGSRYGVGCDKTRILDRSRGGEGCLSGGVGRYQGNRHDYVLGGWWRRLYYVGGDNWIFLEGYRLGLSGVVELL